MKSAKIKSLIIFSFVLFWFFSLAKPSWAMITKTAGNLELVLNSEPLFSPSIIWAPGDSHSVNFTVRNKDSNAKKVQLAAFNTDQTGGLAEKMYVQINEGTTNLYGASNSKTMKDFWDDGEISLSSVSGGGEKTYTMMVSMNSNAGNEYQGMQATFDMRIGFADEKKATVTVAGVSAPGSTTAPPACTATAPLNAPSLTLVNTEINTVILSWAAVAPVTHYSIQYGTAPGIYIFGADNVGNVTNYTVSGLSAGTVYYFQVRGVNNCAPGPWSNEVHSGVVAGAFIAPGPAHGFAPVLGEKTPGQLGEAKTTQKVTPEEKGQIKGEKKQKACWWWLILSLSEFILLFLFHWLAPKKEKIYRFWPLVSVILAALAFIGDHFLAHRYFLPSRYCHLMWLWAMLAAITPYLFFRLWKNKSA